MRMVMMRWRRMGIKVDGDDDDEEEEDDDEEMEKEGGGRNMINDHSFSGTPKRSRN